MTMVSDQEIAKGVEALLRQSDPNVVTTLNGVVEQLEAKLGLDLSHKAGFIRDQINLLLRQQPQPLPQKDHFSFPQYSNSYHLPQHQQQQQQQQQPFYTHFAFQQPQHYSPQFLAPTQHQVHQASSPSPAVVKTVVNTKNAVAKASETPKGR